jgi:uncharacterized protein (TIGR03118 family)
MVKIPQFLIRRFRAMVIGVLGLLAASGWGTPAIAGYVVTNLVSDIPGLAAVTDANLVNPWGMSSSPTSPIWVSDNKTGVTTLYNTAGVPQALVVTIPPPSGGTSPSAPTGQVFNGGTGFLLAGTGTAARFIFATEDGTISGWNPTANPTNAVLKVDNSPFGAVYKGLAIGNNGAGDFLYAANFNSGKIDVFNSSFAATTLAGNFVDPNLPAGFAPFNVQNLDGQLYVTYALQDGSKHEDVAGPGNGFVDVFDLNGNLVKRAISNGPLNSPWGLAFAPANFGTFSKDLLVGNFGDGRIDAFDPTTYAFLGALTDTTGTPIFIEGLWGLRDGNGGNGGALNQVYFTAGISGGDAIEDHGLFGSLSVPEPATLALLSLGLAGLGFSRRRQ